MGKITAEYFEETLDSVFPDKESLEMNILTELPFEDGSTDVIITNFSDLCEDKNISEIYGVLETERYGITVYMYHVKKASEPDYSIEKVEEFLNEDTAN